MKPTVTWHIPRDRLGGDVTDTKREFEIDQDAMFHLVQEWSRTFRVSVVQNHAVPFVKVEIPGLAQPFGFILTATPDARINEDGGALTCTFDTLEQRAASLHLTSLTPGIVAVMDLFEDKDDYFIVKYMCRNYKALPSGRSLLGEVARTKGIDPAAYDFDELCQLLKRSSVYGLLHGLSRFQRKTMSFGVRKYRYRAQDLLKYELVLRAVYGDDSLLPYEKLQMFDTAREVLRKIGGLVRQLTRIFVQYKDREAKLLKTSVMTIDHDVRAMLHRWYHDSNFMTFLQTNTLQDHIATLREQTWVALGLKASDVAVRASESVSSWSPANVLSGVLKRSASSMLG